LRKDHRYGFGAECQSSLLKKEENGNASSSLAGEKIPASPQLVL
jgi:hypothetical protein